MAVANIAGNMDSINLADFNAAGVTEASSTTLTLAVQPGYSLTLLGVGFTYDILNRVVTGGTVQALSFNHPTGDGSGLVAAVSQLNLPITLFGPWVVNNQTLQALQTIFGGNDTLSGSAGADLMRGFAGADSIYTGGGADSIFGGQGADLILAGPAPGAPSAPAGATYLRGENGADTIQGGAAFDDIHGNMGDDVAHGDAGDDWVVGGKDQDALFGDDGADIVFGNLGDDTADGGAGADLIRGGQGNDVLTGGGDADWLSGDRGGDTLAGGAGADIFHSFSGAGLDRVTDFNVAEGDRVQLDLGTTYTVAQVGADTVIDMGAGDQLVLVNVQMSSLAAGSVFLA